MLTGYQGGYKKSMVPEDFGALQSTLSGREKGLS